MNIQNANNYPANEPELAKTGMINCVFDLLLFEYHINTS